MIVLDSYAVLAFLRGEAAAAEVEGLLEGGDDVQLTALGLAEVVDHLVRLAGVDAEEAALDVAQLGLADPVPVDAVTALRAGLLRARHYHRRARAVSLADCVAAEVARKGDAPVATSDPHLLDLCHAEDISVMPLPDTTGSTWRPSRPTTRP